MHQLMLLFGQLISVYLIEGVFQNEDSLHLRHPGPAVSVLSFDEVTESLQAELVQVALDGAQAPIPVVH